MEKNEMIGNAATYGGTITSCVTAPAALINESTMVLIISATGAFVGLIGLLYSIWNGNRNYELQRQELEIRRLEALGHLNQPPQALQAESA